MFGNLLFSYGTRCILQLYAGEQPYQQPYLRVEQITAPWLFQNSNLLRGKMMKVTLPSTSLYAVVCNLYSNVAKRMINNRIVSHRKPVHGSLNITPIH